MKRCARAVRTLGVAAAISAIVMAIGGVGAQAPAASAQSGDAVVKVTAPAEAVKKGADNVEFAVSVDNVQNLGAFQFVLQYDADIFEFQDSPKSEFLGSTGREVICNDPLADAGSARIQCVTLRPTPAGPSGAGVLAVVRLKAKGSGTTDVTLTRVKLTAADETATEIPTTVEGTTFTVESSSGMNWLLWGPIIGLAALVVIGGAAFAVMRVLGGSGRAATAT